MKEKGRVKAMEIKVVNQKFKNSISCAKDELQVYHNHYLSLPF